MPRYAILEHDHPALHWDLLLEAGPTLRTWRLAVPPAPGQRIAAGASFPHRVLYLEYEGPVSGGRGQVRRWDAGTFTWRRDEAACVAVDLEGGRLRGTLTLTQVAAEAWEAAFTPSAEAE